MPSDPLRIALVVNPTAGKGAAARVATPVRDRFVAAGIVVEDASGSSAEDALARIRAAVAGGVDAVVAVGGDGLASTVAQALATTSTPFGLVPAGTGNDLAASLGLPRGDAAVTADRLVAALREGRTRAIDAVRTSAGPEGTWFVNVLGAGFDSAVNERANRMRWPRNRLRYDLAILAELRVFTPVPFSLDLDGERLETEAMLVAVGNGRSYGAGMKICPEAELDDGLLDVTILLPVGKVEFVRVFPRVYKGTHVSHPAVLRRRVREVTLTSPGETAYADGERLADLPVTATCVPGALQVLVP
jgi:diacylglycerol kinase (ATP)